MAASTTRRAGQGARPNQNERGDVRRARSTMMIVLLFIARSSCADDRASCVFGQMYYQEYGISRGDVTTVLVGGMLRRY